MFVGSGNFFVLFFYVIFGVRTAFFVLIDQQFVSNQSFGSFQKGYLLDIGKLS